MHFIPLGKRTPSRIMLSTAQEAWSHRESRFSYGSTLNYNSGFNSRLYGSYGKLGGVHGGAMYSNNMYREGYGGVYESSMYGGGLYNSSFGGPMGDYGMGMSSAYGIQDPNNPYGAALYPLGFWISVVRVVKHMIFVDYFDLYAMNE